MTGVEKPQDGIVRNVEATQRPIGNVSETGGYKIIPDTKVLPRFIPSFVPRQGSTAVESTPPKVLVRPVPDVKGVYDPDEQLFAVVDRDGQRSGVISLSRSLEDPSTGIVEFSIEGADGADVAVQAIADVTARAFDGDYTTLVGVPTREGESLLAMYANGYHASPTDASDGEVIMVLQKPVVEEPHKDEKAPGSDTEENSPDGSAGTKPPVVSQAETYIKGLLGDTIRVAAIVRDDPTKANMTLRVAERRIAELNPKLPYDPRDARVEFASLLINDILSETDHAKLHAQVKLLSLVKPFEENEPLQQTVIDAVTSLESGSVPQENEHALLAAVRSIVRFLPHTETAGRELMGGWNNYIQTIPDAQRRKAMLSEVCSWFVLREEPGRRPSPEDQAWRNAAMLEVYNTDISLGRVDVARLFEISLSTVNRILLSTRNPKSETPEQSSGES